MNKLTIKKNIAPFKGVIIFMILLFTLNIIWKISIKEDETTHLILLWGKFDLTSFFDAVVRYNAIIVQRIMWFLGETITLYSNNVLKYLGGNFVRIVWGCSAIKQSVIFILLLLIYPGPWRHKLWYIPSGVIVLLLFNVLRLVFLTFLVKNHQEYFQIMHEFFKYLFYFVLFMLWVLWEEIFRLKTKKINNE